MVLWLEHEVRRDEALDPLRVKFGRWRVVEIKLGNPCQGEAKHAPVYSASHHPLLCAMPPRLLLVYAPSLASTFFCRLSTSARILFVPRPPWPSRPIAFRFSSSPSPRLVMSSFTRACPSLAAVWTSRVRAPTIWPRYICEECLGDVLGRGGIYLLLFAASKASSWAIYYQPK